MFCGVKLITAAGRQNKTTLLVGKCYINCCHARESRNARHIKEKQTSACSPFRDHCFITERTVESSETVNLRVRTSHLIRFHFALYFKVCAHTSHCQPACFGGRFDRKVHGMHATFLVSSYQLPPVV